MHLAVHHTGQGRSSRVHQPELPRVPTHGGGPVSGTGGATVAGTVASSWHLTAPSWHLTANTVSATDRGGRGFSVRGPPGWHPTATGSAAAHSVTSMGAGIRTGRATDPSTVSDVWAAAAARPRSYSGSRGWYDGHHGGAFWRYHQEESRRHHQARCDAHYRRLLLAGARHDGHPAGS